ncbi:MAG: hypothetical protein IPP96_10025 [Chitinophagaceae bacterium]|nr:hypothetical protein [Chitinophagaceae bacterium]
MNTRWKIFKISNIAEIIIISALIAAGIYISPLPLDGFEDFIVFAFVCSIPVITAINCTGNILLLNHQGTGKKLSLGRKIFFWSFFIAFLGTLILLLSGLLSLYSKYSSHSGNTRLVVRQLMILIAMLVFFLNGLYILVMQVILFIQVRKKYTKGNLLIIEQIGIEEGC